MTGDGVHDPGPAQLAITDAAADCSASELEEVTVNKLTLIVAVLVACQASAMCIHVVATHIAGQRRPCHTAAAR